MPMAAIPALGGIVAGGISTRSRNMRSTGHYPAPRGVGADGGPARAAYAESAEPNEPADSTCDQRHHGDDRAGDCRRHFRGRAGSGGTGQIARRPHQGQRGNDSKVPGGEWATGALVRAATVTPALQNVSTGDRGMRSGSRKPDKRV